MEGMSSLVRCLAAFTEGAWDTRGHFAPYTQQAIWWQLNMFINEDL